MKIKNNFQKKKSLKHF